MPIECQKDSKGNEDWTIGDKDSSKTSPNIVTEDSEWPEWTFNRLFPDYFTIQGTGTILSFAVTVDDYSNIYVSGGLSFGVELFWGGASGRAAGGWIIAEQVPSSNGLGTDWAWKTDSPTEAELESHLTGVSVNGGIGGGLPQTAFLGPGADLSLAISSDPSVSAEGGIYTPQAGGGVTLTGLIYDAGSEHPWFVQKWLHNWGILD